MVKKILSKLKRICQSTSKDSIHNTSQVFAIISGTWMMASSLFMTQSNIAFIAENQDTIKNVSLSAASSIDMSHSLFVGSLFFALIAILLSSWGFLKKQ